MALDQSVIDKAGINPSLSGGLQAREAEALKRQSGVTQQLSDVGQQQQELQQQKSTAMDPLRENIAAKGKDTPQTTAKEEALPEYKRPTMKPEDLNEAFSTLMVASMLTGLTSRTPYNNAMTAMTGAMNGFMKKDEQMAKDSLQEFDRNIKVIKEKNDQKRREVDDAWKKYKNDLGGLRLEIEMIAAKYDDPQLALTAKEKSLTHMQTMADNNLKAVDTAINRAQTLQQHAQTLAETQRHHLVTENQAAGTAPGMLDKETVDFYATQSLSGDNSWQVGLARGKVGQQLIAAVKDRIPKMAAEMGMSPQDVGTNKASYTALSKTLADRQKYSTAVEQLQGTLTKQADLVESLLAKGASESGSPILNKWLQAGRKATGDPDVRAFNAAIIGLGREHQRVLTSPLSNAQLHASAAETADQLINTADTPASIRSVIGVMKKEAANGKQQAHETLDATKKQLRELGKTLNRREEDVPSGIPAGSTIIGKSPEGKDVYQSPDGEKWVP